VVEPLSGANKIPKMAPVATPANNPNTTLPEFIFVVFNDYFFDFMQPDLV
jgi:hypothetical protein